MELTCLFRVSLELRIDTREGLTALTEARSRAMPAPYLPPLPPLVVPAVRERVVDPRPPLPAAGLGLVFFELDLTGLGLFDRLPEE